jgi:hypothetical protein
MIEADYYRDTGMSQEEVERLGARYHLPDEGQGGLVPTATKVVIIVMIGGLARESLQQTTVWWGLPKKIFHSVWEKAAVRLAMIPLQNFCLVSVVGNGIAGGVRARAPSSPMHCQQAKLFLPTKALTIPAQIRPTSSSASRSCPMTHGRLPA